MFSELKKETNGPGLHKHEFMSKNFTWTNSFILNTLLIFINILAQQYF